MCLIKYHVLIFCLLIFNCYALNCHSEGGPKEAELKNIYKRCLKIQEGKNSTSNKNSEQDWREPRGHNGKSDWDTDRRFEREDKNERDEKNSGRNDRNNGKDDRNNGRDRIINNSRYGGKGDTNRNEARMEGNDRMGNKKQMGGQNERNVMMGNSDDTFGRNNYYNGRGFPQSDEFGGMSQYNNYYSSTQTPRRYKRNNRPENSGHRSQYNPNTKKVSGFDDNYRSDEKNSSENNSSKERETDNKACAMHCFLDNLEMTGEDGMPDRYLVAQAITEDVKNEDLRDFLQESIEECFQILDNENTEDKCDFSKNLLLCLSEKGRANCDDWKEDLKF